MEGAISGRRTQSLTFAAIALGVMLITAAAISGTTMFIAFYNGITQIHTLSDVRVNVVRVLFSFFAPLVGGAVLIIAGRTIMQFSAHVEQRRTARVSTERVRREKEHVIDTMLGKDERYILGLVGEKADGALQSDMVLKSGFSKVKTHRILKKLENKELVRRTRFGITNKVIVVKH